MTFFTALVDTKQQRQDCTNSVDFLTSFFFFEKFELEVFLTNNKIFVCDQGFASTRVVGADEHRLLKQHFASILDKWGVRGLGWEIMDEFFRRCPQAYDTFDTTDSQTSMLARDRKSTVFGLDRDR